MADQEPDHSGNSARDLDGEELFRIEDLVEHLLIGLYRTTPEGRVLMANRAMIRLLGYETLEELQQAQLDDLARGQRYQRERFKELIERDGFVAGFESTWTLDDGRLTHLRENARAVKDASGRVLYYEGTVEDLTSQRALEDQLRHAQRMDTVGRLAGGIAHDFNNLLQALLGNVQLLRLEMADSETYAETFDELETLAARGRALTRQLLLFSHREIARPRKVDLNQLVRESSSFLRRLVRANVRLTVETGDGEFLVDADPGQLEQVLANLVMNAVDAMPDGGELLVRTRRSDDGFDLEVVDDGCGIPPELQHRVFEPFYSTKDPAGGAGLGLSVVHGIVTRHGGRIELSSVLGRGTTVRVHLPRHDSGVFGVVPATAAAETVRAPRRYRVLVVEDNDSVRSLFGRMLDGLGYATTLAGSAEEAMALPDDRPVDALLTDFMLPGASGVELAVTLRQRWPQMAALLASGYAEADAVQPGALPEGMKILPKPVDLQVLATELRAALRAHPAERSSDPKDG